MRSKRARRKASRRGSRPESEPSKDDLVKYVQKSSDRGTNLQHILDDFNATPGARKQIKDVLKHRDGYGFVIPKEKIPGVKSDIYIPSALIGSAMNGDKVKVEITLRKPGGRAEGRVVTVEKRARDTVVGQLRYDGQVF